MQVHIKNEKTDGPTESAIGFSCGRFISRKLQLHGVRKTNLGNPHPIGYCAKCNRTHDRKDCIAACAKDKEWRQELRLFLRQLKKDHQYRHHVDLWCWCAPLPCHCDLIKQAILHNIPESPAKGSVPSPRD